MDKFLKYLILILLFISNISLLSQNVIVNTKIFLSSVYQGGSMQTNLLNEQIIPLSHPYSTEPWNYFGDEAILEIPMNVVDWILLELRLDSNVVSTKRACFLLSDGSIVSSDGITKPTFQNLEGGYYYIALYHRNHIPVMSSIPILLNSTSDLYDFSDSQSKAYGTNSLKNLGDGKFGMIAGDGNQNGIVNDLDYGEVANNIFGTAYISGDLDLSGFVNIIDYSQVYNNILANSKVPNAKDEIKNVTTYNELKSAIDNAVSGDVIQIQNDILFPVDSVLATGGVNRGITILVDEDVTIQGVPGLDIDNKTTLSVGTVPYAFQFFTIRGAAVTIRNLHFEGNAGQVASNLIGVMVGRSAPFVDYSTTSVLVDSCEINGFSYGLTCAGWATLEVKNSKIHKQIKYGLGYGVAVDVGGRIIVHDNYFDENRHSTASTGHPGVYYEVYNNVFDTTAYLASGGVPTTNSHVDVHAYPGTYPIEFGGTDLTAAEYQKWANDTTKVYNNDFRSGLGQGKKIGIKVRGFPRSGAWIYNNTFDSPWAWTLAESDESVYIPMAWERYIGTSWTDSLTLHGNMYVSHNTYGDGTPFFTWDPWVKSCFQVNYGSGWNRLAGFGSSVTDTTDLVFGDFDGDNVTDVVCGYGMDYHTYEDSSHIYISFGGWGQWEVLNDNDYDMSSLDVADVDGDGLSDLIYNETTYSSRGQDAWTALPNAFNTYTLYTARDFNGDGEDDPYRISGQ